MTALVRAEVGRCISILRLARGWSQGQLSEASGVTTSAISDYERGKVDPQTTSLFKILEGLGAPLYLLDQAHDFLDLARAVMEGPALPSTEASSAGEGLAELPPEVAAEIGAISAEAARSLARTTRMQLGLLAQLVYAPGPPV